MASHISISFLMLYELSQVVHKISFKVFTYTSPFDAFKIEQLWPFMKYLIWFSFFFHLISKTMRHDIACAIHTYSCSLFYSLPLETNSNKFRACERNLHYFYHYSTA